MKKNAYLAKLEEKQRAREHIVELWTIQLSLDVMAACLNDLYGMGAERLTRLNAEYNRRFPDYMEALTKNPEADYLRDKIDRQQKEIFGDKALTWAERYAYWQD